MRGNEPSREDLTGKRRPQAWTDQPLPELKPDLINHPAHYNSGKIEVIEALEDWRLNFHRANAVKYIARAGKKDPSKEIEDLEKAVWYLRRDIENLKAVQEGRSPLRPNEMSKVEK